LFAGSGAEEAGCVLQRHLLQLITQSTLTSTCGFAYLQGEEQKKLDVISNDIFCNCLRMSGRTGVIASEEEATPVAVEETDSGNYIVVFDPLDGSSNIDAGERLRQAVLLVVCRQCEGLLRW
jgi:fructose-1,6-bisphosphatase